ncbi:MAG: hypothetical protein ACE5EB_09685 [Thermodesulfobacteriota bacterium]
MGFLDFLTPVQTGKKIIEIQIALIGKHVFDNLLSEEEKQELRDFVNNGLETGGVDKTFDGLDVRVRYLLVALAMKKTGVDRGLLKDFKVFVKDPFAIEKYSQALIAAAAKTVRQKYEIEVGF